MLVFEFKLKGKSEQFNKIDEAIRTGQFIRNACLKHWQSNHGTAKNDLQKYCAVLAADPNFPWMVKNHKLAKSISNASWSMFREWLEYFAKVFGKVVIAVPPHYTSQNCSCCGEIVKKSLSVRTHFCSHCGIVLDRDENAAINILIKAIEILENTVGHTGINAQGQFDLCSIGEILLAKLSGKARKGRN